VTSGPQKLCSAKHYLSRIIGYRPPGFTDYVLSVRGALANYKCEILECVSEGMQAFAKMRFSGVHTGEFRGYLSTGQNVHWLGAALFHFDENKICELWVLGDLTGLDALLRENQKRNR